MENQEIKVGSIVILASEKFMSTGRYMTVIAITNNIWATCQWYDEESGNYLEKDFLIATLVRG